MPVGVRTVDISCDIRIQDRIVAHYDAVSRELHVALDVGSDFHAIEVGIQCVFRARVSPSAVSLKSNIFAFLLCIGDQVQENGRIFRVILDLFRPACG